MIGVWPLRLYFPIWVITRVALTKWGKNRTARPDVQIYQHNYGFLVMIKENVQVLFEFSKSGGGKWENQYTKYF